MATKLTKKKTKTRTTKTSDTSSTSEKKTVTYVGILDTLGLDSFDELTGRSAVHMSMRAAANPQRHACMFLAEFDESVDPLRDIRQIEDPWDMWSYINMTCKELRCDPKDAKTIKNMKKLADAKIECTGSAW